MTRFEPSKSPALAQACGWACWVFENTDMPKRKVLQRAARRFGVSMAAVEREVLKALGEEYLAERAERMVEAYRPRFSAHNSRIARVCRETDKHWKAL
jgi:hypothetical protein